MEVGEQRSLVEGQRLRDVDVLVGRGLVEMRSGLILRDRKSGESVSLAMGHKFC